MTTGLLHMVQAAFWFSLMSLCVKVAGERLPAIEIVFVRSVVSLVLTAALIAKAKVSPWGRRRGLLALRGVLGAFALTGFFTAISNLPLGEVTVIHYTHPIFTAVFAAWFLGERLDPRLFGALALSLSGVALIARPDAWLLREAPAGDLPFVGIAFAAAALSAAAYVTVRKLRSTEHPYVIVLYFPLVTVPLATPWVIREWVAPTPREWLALVAVGITTQIAQIHLTRGLASERAGRATSVGYLQVALAALWGAVFFGEIPSVSALGGAALILCGLFVATRSRGAAPGAASGARA